MVSGDAKAKLEGSGDGAGHAVYDATLPLPWQLAGEDS